MLTRVWLRSGVTREHFEEAKNHLSSLKEDPGNDVKLKIYALFKQVRADDISSGCIFSIDEQDGLFLVAQM